MSLQKPLHNFDLFRSCASKQAANYENPPIGGFFIAGVKCEHSHCFTLISIAKPSVNSLSLLGFSSSDVNWFCVVAHLASAEK